MTFSVESLVFRAVGAAVNTAARAANTVLTVMYPPDIGHIWDSPREGAEAALADPHPVGVDDAAGVVPPTPAASLTWRGWCEPAILDVLAEHWPDTKSLETFGIVRCCPNLPPGADLHVWREHVAPLIADRIACNPDRAVLALTSLQKQ